MALDRRDAVWAGLMDDVLPVHVSVRGFVACQPFVLAAPGFLII